MARTCRCPICGRKSSGSAKNRRLSAELKVYRDENNFPVTGSKKNESKLIRTRLKELLKKELNEF